MSAEELIKWFKGEQKDLPSKKSKEEPTDIIEEADKIMSRKEKEQPEKQEESAKQLEKPNRESDLYRGATPIQPDLQKQSLEQKLEGEVSKPKHSIDYYEQNGVKMKDGIVNYSNGRNIDLKNVPREKIETVHDMFKSGETLKELEKEVKRSTGEKEGVKATVKEYIPKFNEILNYVIDKIAEGYKLKKEYREDKKGVEKNIRIEIGNKAEYGLTDFLINWNLIRLWKEGQDMPIANIYFAPVEITVRLTQPSKTQIPGLEEISKKIEKEKKITKLAIAYYYTDNDKYRPELIRQAILAIFGLYNNENFKQIYEKDWKQFAEFVLDEARMNIIALHINKDKKISLAEARKKFNERWKGIIKEKNKVEFDNLKNVVNHIHPQFETWLINYAKRHDLAELLESEVKQPLYEEVKNSLKHRTAVLEDEIEDVLANLDRHILPKQASLEGAIILRSKKHGYADVFGKDYGFDKIKNDEAREAINYLAEVYQQRKKLDPNKVSSYFSQINNKEEKWIILQIVLDKFNAILVKSQEELEKNIQRFLILGGVEYFVAPTRIEKKIKDYLKKIGEVPIIYV